MKRFWSILVGLMIFLSWLPISAVAEVPEIAPVKFVQKGDGYLLERSITRTEEDIEILNELNDEIMTEVFLEYISWELTMHKTHYETMQKSCQNHEKVKPFFTKDDIKYLYMIAETANNKIDLVYYLVNKIYYPENNTILYINQEAMNTYQETGHHSSDPKNDTIGVYAGFKNGVLEHGFPVYAEWPMLPTIKFLFGEQDVYSAEQVIAASAIFTRSLNTTLTTTEDLKIFGYGLPFVSEP